MLTIASAISLTLAAATSQVQPSTVVAGQSTEERLLSAHNVERERLGQAPLVWSDRLVKDARVWAEYMARTNDFNHSPDDGSENPQGENLWMGTKDAYSLEKMVGAWIGEKSIYKPGVFPNVSKTGNWVDVGHYTQLIWYNTTEVGCAIASNKQDDFLVCRYFPTGNWDEQNPLGISAEKIAVVPRP